VKATLICWCGLACALAASAQESVEIYFDPAQPAADTLDFGYVMAGDSLVRQLFIENRTSGEVVIPQGTRPYIAVEPMPPFRDNDPDEFPLEALFPFRVSSNQTRSYPLRYTATLFAQHPAGRHQVALNISVRSSSDTARVVAQRRIVMRATKSFRPLWTDQELVQFDSVYVGSAFDCVAMLEVRNVWRQGISTQIIRFGDARSIEAFALDAESSDIFASGQVKNFRAQFRPAVAGMYALDVLFVHPSPLRGGGPDTTAVQLRGIGVVQQLKCRSVLGKNVEIQGDTIIARNRAIGRADTITLVFQNTGNIPIGVTDTQIEQNGTRSEITVLRPFSIARALQPQALDTVVIVIHPERPGVSLSTLRLQTDLLRRPIFGAPVDAAALRFTLRVESMPQRLVPLQTAIDFGTVAALGTCSEVRFDTLQLENRSDEAVTITALTLPAPFFTTVQTPFRIAPGSMYTVPVSFLPLNEQADISGHLRIESSDTAYSPLAITLRARFVVPPPLALGADAREYVPGNMVLLPLRCGSDTVRFYSAAVLSVSLEPSMAELVGFQTANTAIQGASIAIEPIGPGTYRVQLQSLQPFFARDTFALLVLRTFLGQQPQSSVLINQLRTGTLQCPDAVAGQGTAGSLHVEPFCGMGYKLPVVLPSLVMSDAGGLPDGSVLIECWSDQERTALLDCVSADGRTVAQQIVRLRIGRQQLVVPLELSRGVYGLRLRDNDTGNEARRVVLVR
jgi:hypothetical protein